MYVTGFITSQENTIEQIMQLLKTNKFQCLLCYKIIIEYSYQSKFIGK
jgi:hypothetical protein